MSVPDPDASDAELFASSAVRLFVERARAASDRFELSAENRSAVVEICRRLDGIPLAIELAAARVRSMNPALIEERLDERFRLLSSTRRSQERHRTLLATVSWSYDMLSMDEQSVFRRLAVFPSGFDIAAAEVVAAGDGGGYLLDDLSRLVDRSLVQHDPDTGRYRLLETLRQFGAERLAELGDTEFTADRYLDLYRRLAAQIGLRYFDSGFAHAMTDFLTEYDNLRATANSLRRLGRYDDLLGFCGALFGFLQQRAPAEAFEWIHAALANGTPSEVDRIAAHGFLAHLCHSLNRLDEGLRHASDSLDAFADTAQLDSATALTGRIMILHRLGEFEEALAAARRMVALGEQSHHEFVRLQGRFYMVTVLASMKRFGDAEEILADTMPAARRLGNSAIESIGALVSVGIALETDDRAALLAIVQTVPAQTDDTAISNYLRAYRAYALLDTEPREALRLAIETVRRGDRTGNQVVLSSAVAVTVIAAALCGHANAAEQLYRHMTASPYWDHRNTWEITLFNGATAAVPAEVRDTPPHALSRRELLQLLSELATLL
ncbi:MAG: hypothetical protein ABIQ73_20290 [Acidimicrobiales bacterium]